MALLLNIDTATDKASVSITVNGVSQALVENNLQKEHASFIHKATKSVLNTSGYQLSDIDAFAVTSGPGSYTGLRVGMATAKGFCFAMSKPLITINTLKAMTIAALEAVKDDQEEYFYCPMIDARRMEVFTALYDRELNVIMPPTALVLEETIFDNYSQNKKIMFFGNGSRKFELGLRRTEQSLLIDIEFNANHLGVIAEEAFTKQHFADLFYSQPTYLKEFYSIKGMEIKKIL